MDGRQPLHRFEFDDEPPLDKKVDLESVVYDNALIFQGYGNLALDRAPRLPEAFSHQGLISAFKQSWTKIAM